VRVNINHLHSSRRVIVDIFAVIQKPHGDVTYTRNVRVSPNDVEQNPFFTTYQFLLQHPKEWYQDLVP
jgi:hypothetical protein